MNRDIGKLRVFEILKSDEEYKSILKKRIQRLNSWKPKTTYSKLRKSFDECIALTEDCNRQAEAIKTKINHLAATFPQDMKQLVDRVSTFQRKSAEESDELKELMKFGEAREFFSDFLYESTWAKEIIYEWLDKGGDKILLDFAEGKLPEDTGDLQKASMKLQVSVLYSNVEVYSIAISACVDVINIARLIRGFFYSAIVNIQGGELDRKIFWDHMENIVEEAINLTPHLNTTLGVALSIRKLMKEINDVSGELWVMDAQPKIVKDAEFLELYTLKYQLALRIWKEMARLMITSLKGFIEDMEIYTAPNVTKAMKRLHQN